MVWLISSGREPSVKFSIIRAFQEAGYKAIPRDSERLIGWIDLFERQLVRECLPQLMIFDATVPRPKKLIRTLRGKSPWNGIPTVAHGPNDLGRERKQFYAAGFAAFCEEPAADALPTWSDSLARYWTRVAILPMSDQMSP